MPKTPSPTDTIAFAALRLRLNGGGLFGAHRALSWLREESPVPRHRGHGARTPRGDGFDRVRYRNGVREPLDEAGVEAQEELS